VLATLGVLLAAGCGSSAPKPLAKIGAGLSGPKGSVATVYAKGLTSVSALALDKKGRLWVTTSAATKHKHDGVYLVAKPGAKPVKVIKALKGPLGLTWAGDALYVTSMGRVDRFTGLTGTRFAHRKRILREPSGHGWNNGILRTSDGRLVMSISSACDHCKPKSMWSASILSFQPDGSDVRVYARNVRAGFGLAIRPDTGGLLVSMNQRDDLGAKTPGDWLAAVREGQDWGFPDCYGQGGEVCSGVPEPLAVLDKHAAAGGVAISGTSALVAEWALGKVLRVALDGSGKPQPLLTGLKHPLALLALPGGDVLVGDWGTGIVYRVKL
jgi:glucose/arabinose dehydrogenase